MLDRYKFTVLKLFQFLTPVVKLSGLPNPINTLTNPDSATKSVSLPSASDNLI